MPHPLDGALDRISRAEKHLADLKARIGKAEAHLTLMKFQREGRRTSFGQKRFKPFARPSILSILVGETVYNLRAALDYLVFELARLDDPMQPHDRTQFPIESTEEGFWSHQKIMLNGINRCHVALIERLQPYRGCQWTKRLAEISNSDKHKLLPVLFGRAEQTGVFSFNSSKPLPPNRYADRAAPKGVHVHRPTLFVQFADGALVTDTLEEVKTRVAETLDAFKPEF